MKKLSLITVFIFSILISGCSDSSLSFIPQASEGQKNIDYQGIPILTENKTYSSLTISPIIIQNDEATFYVTLKNNSQESLVIIPENIRVVGYNKVGNEIPMEVWSPHEFCNNVRVLYNNAKFDLDCKTNLLNQARDRYNTKIYELNKINKGELNVYCQMFVTAQSEVNLAQREYNKAYEKYNKLNSNHLLWGTTVESNQCGEGWVVIKNFYNLKCRLTIPFGCDNYEVLFITKIMAKDKRDYKTINMKWLFQ